MNRSPWIVVIVAMACSSLPLLSQVQPTQPRPQTPRQALIEMLTHGAEAIPKHLTVEVQDLLKTSGGLGDWGVYVRSVQAQPGFQTFDSGDVLFTFTDPLRKANYEVRVDSEDLSGDEDSLQLSLHAFQEGKELEDKATLLSPRFSVFMKLQQNVWRLNKLSVGIDVAIGDPEFVKQTLLHAGSTDLHVHPANDALPQAHTEVQFDSTGSAPPSTPNFPPDQILSLLGIAEHTYAELHPDTGFTCSLKDLSDTSKAMGVDEQVNTGTYNGYHFALSGCEGKPAGSYQLVAEPLVLAQGAKAFCSDATANVRISEDGRGATCLVSGKVKREETDSEEGGMVGFRVPGVESKPAK